MDVKNKNTVPVSLPIKKIIEESSIVRTYVFDYSIGAKPGQFAMMWVHGVDQKPMSFTYSNENEFALTVLNRGGAFSEALFSLKEGDLVGITGPFGTYFNYKDGDHLALIGGGSGSVPMYFVAIEALKRGCRVEYITSAGTPEKLLFVDDLKDRVGLNMHVGEIGVIGEGGRLLKKVLNENKIDRIFSCSHELAMKEVSDTAFEEKIQCQLALERYMKCAFGICGQCAMDHLGLLVCKQGSVFNHIVVRNMKEFGKYHRDSVGRKIEF